MWKTKNRRCSSWYFSEMKVNYELAMFKTIMLIQKSKIRFHFDKRKNISPEYCGYQLSSFLKIANSLSPQCCADCWSGEENMRNVTGTTVSSLVSRWRYFARVPRQVALIGHSTPPGGVTWPQYPAR